MVEPSEKDNLFLDTTVTILPALPILGNIREARRALVSVDKRPSADGEEVQTRVPLEVSPSTGHPC